MKKTAAAILALLIAFTLLSTQKTTVTEAETEDMRFSLKSTVTYSNPVNGNFTWDLTEDDRTIGLFMNNSWQSTELKSATYSLGSIKNDEDGNRIGLLELPKQRLLPGENLSFTIEYEIVAKPRFIPDLSESESGILNDIPSHLAQAYAAAEGTWAQTDPSTQELAHDIAGNQTKVLEIVKALIEWIKDNINYTTHEIPLYADQTVASGRGDCDDQAILLIALLRTLGIPSYLQIGAIYIPDYAEVSHDYWNNSVKIVEKRIGRHGWTVAYIPPWGWLPVDLTYVPEGLDNPLNAILQGAVTQQNTVQYMNISKTDYVADSAEARSFLVDNGFQIQIEDEMTYLPQDSGVRGFNPFISAILIAAIVAMGSLVIFMMMRRRRRKLEKQKPPTEN
jgi:transglutaminase-like putative cysteine protease